MPEREHRMDFTSGKREESFVTTVDITPTKQGWQHMANIYQQCVTTYTQQLLTEKNEGARARITASIQNLQEALVELARCGYHPQERKEA